MQFLVSQFSNQNHPTYCLFGCHHSFLTNQYLFQWYCLYQLWQCSLLHLFFHCFWLLYQSDFCCQHYILCHPDLLSSILNKIFIIIFSFPSTIVKVSMISALICFIPYICNLTKCTSEAYSIIHSTRWNTSFMGCCFITFNINANASSMSMPNMIA